MLYGLCAQYVLDHLSVMQPHVVYDELHRPLLHLVLSAQHCHKTGEVITGPGSQLRLPHDQTQCRRDGRTHFDTWSG